jgi:hypothetical protein
LTLFSDPDQPIQRVETNKPTVWQMINLILPDKPFLFPTESDKPNGGQSEFDVSYPQQVIDSNQSVKYFDSCQEGFNSVLDASRVEMTWRKNFFVKSKQISNG